MHRRLVRSAALIVFTLLLPMLRAQQAIDDAALRQLPLSKMVFPEVGASVQPTLFRLHGQNVLCYELFIVNMGNAPVELSRIEAYAQGTATPLLNATGTALTAALKHSAKDQPAAGAISTIAPGEQIIYYAWIELPRGAAPPKQLKHVLTMRKQGSTEDILISAAQVDVKAAAKVIQSPLRGSNWVAGNGPSNTSHHRTTIVPLDGKAYIPQRFAIDWVEIDKSGKTFSGDASKNENYFCYGKKAHAVADGVVSEVKDGIPQNVPGATSRAVPITLETIGGNHVIIDLGGGVYAFYAHLQPGSLRVKLGDHVKAGEVIGLVGNSGNSTEPHLHFHLIDHSSPLAGEGLPFSYPTYQLLGKGSLDGESVKTEWLTAPQVVRGEIPAENDIVQFADETN